MSRWIAAFLAAAGLCATTLVVWQASQPASATGSYELHLDCDVASPGIQSSCAYASGVTAIDVDVVLVNASDAAVRLGAFDFELVTPNQPVINPLATACDPDSSAYDCNPDFAQADLAGSFSCSPPVPEPDLDLSPASARSRLACYTGAGDGPVIAPAGTLKLATVHYATVNGVASLSLQEASFSDDTLTEFGSCNPTNQIAAACFGAVVAIGSPTNTPTITPTCVQGVSGCPTFTNTPEPTPTNHPTGAFLYGVFVDCDTALPGIQDECNAPSGLPYVDVDVVLVNNTTAVQSGIFEFTLDATSSGDLDALAVPCVGPFWRDCNPDFDESSFTGGWACGPPTPISDANPAPEIVSSTLSCFNNSYDSSSIPANSLRSIARMRYLTTTGGTITFQLANVAVYDVGVSAVMTCAPAYMVEGACAGATLQVGATLNTPTPTITPTPSPTVTLTPTCIQGESGCPTPTNSPTMTPTNQPTGEFSYGLFVDCEPALPGIQDECNAPSGLPYVVVDVVLVNNSTALQAGAVGFTLGATSTGDLDALAVPCVDPFWRDCNPDFDESSFTGAWSCGPPTPMSDTSPAPEVVTSSLGCFNGASDSSAIPANSTRKIGRIRYLTPGGTITFQLFDVNVYDAGFSEVMTCLPVISVEGACAGATLYTGATQNTPTPTFTPTPSPTTTPSPTCVQGTTGCPTPTNTPTITNTPEPTPTNQSTGGLPFGLFVDCNPATPGVQNDCYFPPVSAVDVDVILVNNSGASMQLGAFGFRAITNQHSLQPIPVTCDPGGLNCNPDFSQTSVTGSWSCAPPAPWADDDPSPSIASSTMGCFDGVSDGPVVASGSTVKLATLHYAVPQRGNASIELIEGNVYDVSFTELHSCYPTISVAGYCAGATLHLGTDNCVGLDNPDQANTNGESIPLPKPVPAWNDVTNPAEDFEGDACDSDIDGDGLSNSHEASLGTQPSGWDTDGDRTSDGAEAACGSDPLSPSNNVAGADSDNDRLPNTCEAAYGTNPQNPDSDGDGVRDGVEVRYWLTNPLSANTDGDTCSDGREVATVNGDRTVNVADLGILASKFGVLSIQFRPYDQNGDGTINPADLGFAASKYGTCTTSP